MMRLKPESQEDEAVADWRVTLFVFSHNEDPQHSRRHMIWKLT